MGHVCISTNTPPRPIHRVVVVSADSVYGTPDRSVHRSLARRDQLVKLCLMVTRRQCHDRLCDLHAGVSYRTRTQHVTARTQVEENAARFGDVWHKLGQSCQRASALLTCASLNPLTHPWAW